MQADETNQEPAPPEGASDAAAESPKPSPDWAPVGPNGEKPNIRLAHTPAGSMVRLLHGERYPAVAYVRGNDVEYGLPVKGTGEPNEGLQAAGFYSAFADRICRICPHYVLISR